MAAAIREFDFMRSRLPAGILSMLIVLLSVVAIVVNGLNFGLDFTGGTLVEVGYPEAAKLSEVRERLAAAGYERHHVVHFGSDREVLIRLPGAESATTGQKIVEALSGSDREVSLRRVEVVGPQMGDELRDLGGLALLLSLVGVGIYVAIRFQWKLAVGAVVALAHDPIVTLGAFALFQWEVDFSVLAAVLALIGYSINDTVVVYDRLRENFRKLRRMDRLAICNASLNQTLGRTLMTSGVTLLAVIALLVFGGDTLRGFSMTLTIGIVIGTYSSIYVATNFALWLGLDRGDLLLPVRDDKEFQESP
jgi:preprotein translocase subunit SecF